MEIYIVYKDYNWMMEMVEKFLEYIVIEVIGYIKVEYEGNLIDYVGLYCCLSMYEFIEEYIGIDIFEMDEVELCVICKKLYVEVDESMGCGKLIDEIFGEKVEANLIQFIYIIDYFIEMMLLVKKYCSKFGLVECFELFVNGKEIVNVYIELNDLIDQWGCFEEQFKLAEWGDEEVMVLDDVFLWLLEYGMFLILGFGIGIDCLIMFMINQYFIQEVLFFLQMCLQKKQEEVLENVVE